MQFNPGVRTSTLRIIKFIRNHYNSRLRPVDKILAFRSCYAAFPNHIPIRTVNPNLAENYKSIAGRIVQCVDHVADTLGNNPGVFPLANGFIGIRRTLLCAIIAPEQRRLRMFYPMDPVGGKGYAQSWKLLAFVQPKI